MDNMKLKGSVEVILEDRYGTVKHREKQDNHITDAFSKYILFDAMNHSSLYSTLRSNIRQNYNFLERTSPSSYGIYALSEPIDIQGKTYAPPYVNIQGNMLSDKVVFYNAQGYTIETDKVMIPADTKCYLDYAKNEIVVEYQKSSCKGTVKSVYIGRAHDAINNLYAINLRDYEMPTSAYTGYSGALIPYLIEHTADGTVLWRNETALKQIRFNFKTKEYKTYSNSVMYANINTYQGGVVIGDTIYKINKKSANVATIDYVTDWKNKTSVSTKDLSFILGNKVADNTALPVLVAKPESNKLEVFMTVSIGLHGKEYGCNVQKAVVNLADLSYVIEDLGILAYGIGNQSTDINSYSTGLYHDGKYYLPFYYVQYAETTVTYNKSDYQDGVILSDDCKTVYDLYNCRNASSYKNQLPVINELGVMMCRVGATELPYVINAHVISGVNLGTPVHKDFDDTLRIIYRYRIG